METYASYTAWKTAQGIASESFTDTCAEMAWNAAIAQMEKLVGMAFEAEMGDAVKIIVLIQEELNLLKS